MKDTHFASLSLKEMLFFGNPTDHLTLVDLLRLTLAAKALRAHVESHIAWLATYLHSTETSPAPDSNPSPQS